MFGKLFRKNKKQNDIMSNYPVTVPLSESSVVLNINEDIVKIGCEQSQGKRHYQEDSYGFSDISDTSGLNKRGLLAVVADGMGGLKNGREISARLAGEFIKRFAGLEHIENFSEIIPEMVCQINNYLCGMYCEGDRIVSGSTLVAVNITKGTLFHVAVGDSRIYLIRQKRLYQITEDDDYLNQLLEGVIAHNLTLMEAKNDVQKDKLAKCIGDPTLSEGEIECGIRGLKLYPDDMIVMCSDGLYNALDDNEIIESVNGDPQISAETLVRKALAKNYQYQDNISVITISYNN